MRDCMTFHLPAVDLAGPLGRGGVRDVQRIFPDVSGDPRGKRMPAPSIAEGIELRRALANPMKCVTGEYSDDASFPDADADVGLLPDPATLERVPWVSTPRYPAGHEGVEPDRRVVPVRAALGVEARVRTRRRARPAVGGPPPRSSAT